MQSASRRYALLVGALAMAPGCYSPYGYQSPYGPAPYGQPYGTQPGGPVYTVPQGQPYVPGGVQPGGPTPLTPPGGSPSTYDTNGPVNFPDTNNTNAPGFNSNPPTGGNNNGNKTVPLPGDDPTSSGGPAASAGGLTPTSSQQFDNELQTPFGQESTNRSPAAPGRLPTEAAEEADPFETPIRKSSASEFGSGTIRKVSLESSSAPQLNPYGRDKAHANPEWLRGVVDYDQKQRTWQIIYSATPDPRDPNGGSLTLGSHPNLAQCQSGDVVLVEGAIDASRSDLRGKPLYVLDNVTPLVAK